MAVIFNDEQRKLIFEILPVDRIQDDEDPWWNVHIVFQRFCVSYDDVRESLTESEIKETISMIDKYLERIENHDLRLMILLTIWNRTLVLCSTTLLLR